MTPQRLAVVYRGPASLPGCPEAAAHALRSSPHRFRVAFTDGRRLDLTGASLYCQPGGGELGPAWRRLRRDAGTVRDFVGGGGRYLGFCLGAYLAGHDPGFGLLDGDVDSYAAPGRQVTGDAPRIVEVEWGGRRRSIYFEDGCYLAPGPAARVVARYPDGLAAATVSPYGAGWVGVAGPHPEATDDWFADEGLPPLAPPTADLAHDLIAQVMEP